MDNTAKVEWNGSFLGIRLYYVAKLASNSGWSFLPLPHECWDYRCVVANLPDFVNPKRCLQCMHEEVGR